MADKDPPSLTPPEDYTLVVALRIGSAESSICEEGRRSNPNDELFIWIAALRSQ